MYINQTSTTNRPYAEKKKFKPENANEASTDCNYAFVGCFFMKQKMATSCLNFKQCDPYNRFTLVCF